jgi:hypothetical protein
MTFTQAFRTMAMGLSLAGALLAGSAIAFDAQARSPVRAKTPARNFDGLWSVLIITEKGTCDRGYRYAVRIQRGVVGHADPASSSFTIRGRVSAGGQIRVSVIRGDKRADGSGRMGRSSGSGTWRSAKGECSGVWTAERRGA